MKRGYLATGLVCGVVLVSVGLYFFSRNQTPDHSKNQAQNPTQTALPFASIKPTFVGATSCEGCHAKEFAAWKGSHHEQAMQRATEQSVLGNFHDARLTYNGITTTFTQRKGQFVINTDGPDGKLSDYPVRYTFGVAPLQQYLVDMPGGRLQAVSIAWDSRTKEQGGQRWFHLYPKEKINYKDELHWTKLAQNWNFMCAECHSTNVKKNFDVATNRFNTTWSEINVACEACHGPASKHVAWAKQEPGTKTAERKGLVFLLNERKGVSWTLPNNSVTAVRNQPRSTTAEIDTCARCHSRRSTLTEDYTHGKPLMDTHLPALLTAPLYHPDGQIKEEDFEYGSFLQSKMFRHGVTCGDCHEPHSLKLRATNNQNGPGISTGISSEISSDIGKENGNQTCLQCHRADSFDTPQHHFHSPQGAGARCAACHMPTTDFMVVHARHDHSIRIPRPDLSLKLKTPNACNQCHADQTAAWAQARIEKWYGKKERDWHFGETLFDAQRQWPQAGQDLIAVAASPNIAAIARASATALLPGYSDPTIPVALPRLLSDESPLVRRAALEALIGLAPQDRLRLASRLLDDKVLSVRIEAARVLSLLPRSAMTAAQQRSFDIALREYIGVAQANAEHPQSHVNLGLLYADMGQNAQAEQAYSQAIKLDAAYAPAYVNLADLYRQQKNDAKAESTLLAARAAVGDNAAIEHALGLQYVRSKQLPKALVSLAKAAQLQPDSVRYGYVYAIALDANAEKVRALQMLQSLHVKQPYDRDVLIGLVSFNQASRNIKAARGYAQKLVDMDPRYGSVEQLLQQMATP